MTTPQLGPIFPPTVDPVHVGAYRAATSYDLLAFADMPLYRWWNGESFSAAEFTSERARKINDDGQYARAPAHSCFWQGLADEPTE